MPRYAVILPAAGSSSRFGQRKKKVFTDLAGRPVWVRSVEHFVDRPDVVQTILVLAAEDLADFRQTFRANLAFMNLTLVEGGGDRAASVANGLAAVTEEADFIAIHDAARPLLAASWIDQVFQRAAEHGAAILANPLHATIKRTHGDPPVIRETVPRERLWAAQTPQVFRRDWLAEAIARQGTLRATDEAQLLEQAGHSVAIVPCSPMNIKITEAEDLRIAAAFLPLMPKGKGLHGLHPFSDENPLGL